MGLPHFKQPQRTGCEVKIMADKIYSNLMKSLSEGRFTFTGEIEPVKTTSLKKIIEDAKTLKGHVVAANVTDSPAALAYMNSLIPSYIIQKKAGLEAIYQVTCRDRNRIGLFSDLLAAGALGIKNILALTGDHTSLGDNPEAKPVFDLDSQQLVYMIRKMVDEGTDLTGHKIEEPPKFHVGVAAQPAMQPLEPEILKLERKINLGAEFVQTQVVYDIDIAKQFLRQTAHIKAPILIGISPLKSTAMAKWMIKNLPGIVIPDEVMRKFEAAEAKGKDNLMQENIETFGEFIKEIKKTTRAAGMHIMAIGFEWIVPKIIECSGVRA